MKKALLLGIAALFLVVAILVIADSIRVYIARHTPRSFYSYFNDPPPDCERSLKGY
jgi:hypothetical protein